MFDELLKWLTNFSYCVETKCPQTLFHKHVVFELLKRPCVLPKYKQLNGLIIAISPKLLFFRNSTIVLW